MKFFTSVLLLQLKRLLRRPSTLLCLLAAPLLCLGLGLAAAGGQQAIRVGVLLPKNSRYARHIWNSLAAGSNEEMQFVPAESQTQVEEHVAAGDWECGYLLPQNLDDRLENGQYTRLVVRVDGPATRLGSVLDWSLAAALLDSAAADLANAALVKNGVLAPGDAARYEDLARQMFTAKNALHMELVPLNSGAVPAGSGTRLAAASLLRGMLALALLLFTCLGAVWFTRDRLSGFFARLRPYQGATGLYLPFFAACAVLSAGVGLLCLASGVALFPASFGSFFREALLLLLYLLPLGAFSFLLAMLFCGREGLLSLLPFLLVGCLVLCPILVDLSAYVPWLSAISAALPPTGYLRAAAGAASPLWMPAQTAGYGALGLLWARLGKKL